LTAKNLLTTREALFQAIRNIQPEHYRQTRNYLDGAVSWLSPYVTHGVIDTVDIADTLLAQHSESSCEKLLYELAWREYFHRVWQTKGNRIFQDLHRAQSPVDSNNIPKAIHDSKTHIHVLDDGINQLKSTGWMHNHLRMWLAAATCNVGRTHWLQPAQWLYYHLLDGDLASNSLSWQWIAGSASHRKYLANQDNINRYSKTEQHNTWLDHSYEELENTPVPENLQDRIQSLLLPQSLNYPQVPTTTSSQIALRSMWNLDPTWCQSGDWQHVVFIERQQVKAWPLSNNRWAFIESWAKRINAEIWLDDVEVLCQLQRSGTRFVRREYPACNDWPGEVEPRRFVYRKPQKPFKSFSGFWKQVKS